MEETDLPSSEQYEIISQARTCYQLKVNTILGEGITCTRFYQVLDGNMVVSVPF
jgi:hypothetical protein